MRNMAGYDFYAFAFVAGANVEKSDRYTLEWTQSGKVLATANCQWGHDRGDKPGDIIGVNCSVGPEHLREPVRYLCQHAPTPVSVRWTRWSGTRV